MKKFTKYLFLAAFFAIMTVGSISAQKIGYFNSLQLMSEMPRVKQVEQDLQTYQKQLSKQIETKIQALNTKKQQGQAAYEAGSLSPVQQENLLKEISADEQAIMQLEKDLQNKLLQRQAEKYQPIEELINSKIKEVAKENGFTFILDSAKGIILYADDNLDVTSLLKAKMGM